MRPDDEPPVAAGGDREDDTTDPAMMTSSGDDADMDDDSAVEEPDEDDGVRLLSDRLMTELTAHRTLALREAMANDLDVAFLAILHVLCLKLFYRYGLDSCLEIEPKSVMFGHAPGLADTPAAKAIETRHDTWATQLPKEPGELWDILAGMDSDSRQALFAHCVASTINAVYQAYDRRPKAIAHAGRLAEAVKLDMAAAGWRPTVDTYLSRVSKARILDAVREAKGEAAAERIAYLKKAEMAKAAEDLLAATAWVPELLRTPGRTFVPKEAADIPEPENTGSAGDRQGARQAETRQAGSRRSCRIAISPRACRRGRPLFLGGHHGRDCRRSVAPPRNPSGGRVPLLSLEWVSGRAHLACRRCRQHAGPQLVRAARCDQYQRGRALDRLRHG